RSSDLGAGLAWVAVEEVEAGVRRDPVQPGAEGGPALVARPVAPGAQERLLNQIFGILEGGEHPVAVDLQLRTVALSELGDGQVIAGLKGAGQLVDAIRNRPAH